MDTFLDQLPRCAAHCRFLLLNYWHCYRDRPTAKSRQVWDVMAQQFHVNTCVQLVEISRQKKFSHVVVDHYLNLEGVDLLCQPLCFVGCNSHIVVK